MGMWRCEGKEEVSGEATTGSKKGWGEGGDGER